MALAWRTLIGCWEVRGGKRIALPGAVRGQYAFFRTLFFQSWFKGKLSWAVNLKKTAWTSQVWFKAASMQGKTARIWRPFGGERDNSRQKPVDSVNEKWPENLACWHKRIYLNACAAHDSFPLNENKRGLGVFLRNISNNNTPWNISVAFLESCLSISEASECLTGENMKRDQETQR